MENERYNFMNSEVWSLTIGGAFQRAGVYKEGVSDKEKNDFKEALKMKVDEIVEQDYTIKMEDGKKHFKNIKELAEWTSEYQSILSGGRFKLGVAQKLLNLYLKYLWCLEKYPEPPHFPIDRIIQEKMGKVHYAWTKMDTEAEYWKVINEAKPRARDINKSLAEWELITFSRR